jgi:hypothetical protein
MHLNPLLCVESLTEHDGLVRQLEHSCGLIAWSSRPMPFQVASTGDLRPVGRARRCADHRGLAAARRWWPLGGDGGLTSRQLGGAGPLRAGSAALTLRF